MTAVQDKLPDRLHKLITLALADMDAAVEAGHRISMTAWLVRAPNEPCVMCMAGAVMYNTLGLGEDLATKTEITPGGAYSKRRISADDTRKLNALNMVRAYHWRAAVDLFYNAANPDPQTPNAEEAVKALKDLDLSDVRYEVGPRAWRMNMDEAVAVLQRFDI